MDNKSRSVQKSGATPVGVVGAGFLQVWDQLQPPVVGVLEGPSLVFGHGRGFDCGRWCRPVVGFGRPPAVGAFVVAPGPVGG